MTAPHDTVLLSVRLPRDVKQRLSYHAERQANGNASVLARRAIETLVKILDQQEKPQ